VLEAPVQTKRSSESDDLSLQISFYFFTCFKSAVDVPTCKRPVGR
jgi:hypothetical protein